MKQKIPGFSNYCLIDKERILNLKTNKEVSLTKQSNSKTFKCKLMKDDNSWVSIALNLVAVIDSDEGILTSEELGAVRDITDEHRDITDEQFRYILNNHPKTLAMREALMADAVTHMINDW